MSEERTLVLIKPDGVARGLMGEKLNLWYINPYKTRGIMTCLKNEHWF